MLQCLSISCGHDKNICFNNYKHTWNKWKDRRSHKIHRRYKEEATRNFITERYDKQNKNLIRLAQGKKVDEKEEAVNLKIKTTEFTQSEQ